RVLVVPLRLADAERERGVAVLAIPDVSEVVRDLARPEKCMRRWEHREGTRGASLDRQEAIARLHRHLAFIPRAAELIVLPCVGDVAPYSARRASDGEPLDPRVVLVGNGALVGFRDRFLTNQVGAFVDRVLEAPRKDAELQ